MNPSQIRNFILVAIAVILIAGSRTVANLVIEYQWWQEMQQLSTWYTMLLYEVLPAAIASVLAWLALLWAHSRGAAFAAVPEAKAKLYTRIVALALLVVAVMFIGSAVDHQKVMAYAGSLGVTPAGGSWTDPVFDKDLSFYLFKLPFYLQLMRFLFFVAIFSVVAFWATGRGWQLFEKLKQFRAGGGSVEEFDPGPNPLLLEGATQTNFARVLASVVLLGVAAWFYLGQYALLLNNHPFMTGMDWVDEYVALPFALGCHRWRPDHDSLNPPVQAKVGRRRAGGLSGRERPAAAACPGRLCPPK